MRTVVVTGSKYYPVTKEQWEQLPVEDQLECVEKGVALMQANLDAFPPDWDIVTGGARGPDTWAEQRALKQGREVTVIEANYEKYGKDAQRKRNKDMLLLADDCLVFWDGESHNTNHFIREAFRSRKNVYVIGPTGTPWAIWDEDFWNEHPDPTQER